jgi:chromosomal replication initiator protein
MIEGIPEDISPPSGQALWLTCVDRLAQEIPEQQFNTWIRPLAATVAKDRSKVSLQVANRFKMDWIRAQYATRIAALLESIHGAPVILELVLAPREGPSRTSPAPRTVQEQVAAELPDLAPAEALVSTGPKTRLNPALTFSTLVEGSANRMARAAAMHVAGSLGQLYNPLFIYGGVGLGKTHLVHAIGNHLLADRPQAKVLYIHAEQFVSDVVKAYQRKTFDEFKERYHSLDLLLIDDVQFFASRNARRKNSSTHSKPCWPARATSC